MEEKNLYKLFPQPVFKFKLNNYEEHNKDLLKYIYDLYNKDKIGVQRSNVNGWHSKSFIMSKKDTPPFKFFQETKRYVLEVFKKYGWKYDPNNVRLTEMWAIINKKNNLNTAHTHPNNYLSAAYYVKVSKNCGTIKFLNPNSISRERHPLIEKDTDLNKNTVEIIPNEGDLLIFPAYLTHSVNRNMSGEDRVVISFNIDILKS